LPHRSICLVKETMALFSILGWEFLEYHRNFVL
jgi:hypothetical protein